MKPSFYPAWILPALLAACGDGEVTEAPGPTQESVFTLPQRTRETWAPPGDAGYVPRWIAHLETGSRESIRFAKQRLQESGIAAAPALEEAIRADLRSTRSFGKLVSMAEMLGVCGDERSAPVLLDLAEQNRISVVRTAAFEAVGRIGSEASVPRLVALLPHLSEQAPRTALITALGRIGSADAVAVLEAEVRSWLEGGGADGSAAWNALLISSPEPLGPALVRLDGLLAPYQRVQALAIRVDIGERDLEEPLRAFLDPTAYSASATRELALAALAELGDWSTVLEAARDPDPRMHLALVAQLRRPDAAEANIGEDVLDLYTEAADPDLMFNATLGLVERGQTNRIDPWLRQVREFPTGTGSLQALTVLSKQGMSDPRTAGILIERWSYCDVPSRLDLISALVRTEDPRAARFLGAVATDRDERLEVRQKAATTVANFPDQAVDELTMLWETEPTLRVATWVLPGLGRYPQDVRVREFLLELAGGSTVPDGVRKAVFDLLPAILRVEADGMLLELRDAEPRADVRAYLDALLVEYF